jgi:plastocyanin
MTIDRMLRRRLPHLVALLLAACSGEARDGDVRDAEPRVMGTAPAEGLGFPNVVTLAPEGPAASPLPADTLLMDQLGLAFFPSVLLVRAGQTVEFRNSEITDHNVKVRSLENDSTLFNVGSVRGDPHYFHFDREGGYAVSCDIHSGMTASIVVVSTPWVARVQADGSFAIGDVPAGSYRVALWSRDPVLRTEESVLLPATGAVTVDLH